MEFVNIYHFEFILCLSIRTRVCCIRFVIINLRRCGKPDAWWHPNALAKPCMLCLVVLLVIRVQLHSAVISSILLFGCTCNSCGLSTTKIKASLLRHVALVAQRPTVIKLFRGRSVGLCIGASVRRSVQCIVEKRRIGSGCRLAS